MSRCSAPRAACAVLAMDSPSIILPVYLSAIGFSPVQIGFVAAASLFGTALLTLLIGFVAPRHDLRRLMLFGAILTVCTGLTFPNAGDIVLISLVAFLGSINPSTSDLGVLVPLEHAMLAQCVADRQRTHAFARYSLIGALSMAAGSLAAALPDILVPVGLSQIGAFKLMFYLYAAFGLVAAALYHKLPRVQMQDAKPSAPLGPSRGIVIKLAALFSLDAFAGGFVVQSLLTLWLFEKFDLSLAAASLFFFWSSVLTAFSYLVAARLAKRIGLVNTMVFTHIPANLFLDPGGVLIRPDRCARVAAAALRAFADGRSGAQFLRNGGGDAGRADGCREPHRGAAQPCDLDQPRHGRRAADDAVLSPSAGAVRRLQDRL